MYKVFLFSLLNIIGALTSFASNPIIDTNYKEISIYSKIIKTKIDSLEKSLKVADANILILKETFKFLKKQKPQIINSTIDDTFFISKNFRLFEISIDSLYKKLDPTSKLLDSLYYSCSYGWVNTVDKKRYEKDQKILSSYYYLGNTAVRFIKSKQVSESNLEEKGVGVLTAELNAALAKLKETIPENFFMDLTNASKANKVNDELFKKMAFHLKAIFKNEKGLFENLEMFATYYESYWNTLFIHKIKNINTIAAKNLNEDDKLLNEYYTEIQSSLGTLPTDPQTQSNFLLSYSRIQLDAKIREGIRSALVSFKVESILQDSNLLDTLSTEELAYFFNLKAIKKNFYEEFCKQADGLQKSTIQAIKEYELQLTQLEMLVNYLSDEENIATYYFPFSFNISSPISDKNKGLNIDIFYKVNIRDSIRTGLSYKALNLNLQNRKSIDSSFEKLKYKQLSVSDSVFGKFLTELGFLQQFLSLPSKTGCDSNPICFTYLGEKIVWDIYNYNDLDEYKNKIPLLKSTPDYQIEKAIQNVLIKETKSILSSFLSGKNASLFRCLPINWVDLELKNFKSKIVNNKVYVNIKLNQIDPAFDTSIVAFTFDKEGFSKPNLSISGKFYLNVLNLAFPGLSIKQKSSSGHYSLIDFYGKSIGTVIFNETQLEFKAEKAWESPIYPDWSLKLEDFTIDFLKRKIDFNKARLFENADYSRFNEMIQLTGEIDLSKPKLNVTFSAEARKIITNTITENLVKWNLLPGKVIIKDVNIDAGILNVTFKGDGGEEVLSIGSETFQPEKLKSLSTIFYKQKEKELESQWESIRSGYDKETIKKFIEKYKKGNDTLVFSPYVFAVIEEKQSQLLKLGIYAKLEKCKDKLFSITLSSSSSKPVFEESSNECLKKYIQSLLPSEAKLNLVSSTYLHNEFLMASDISVNFKGFSGKVTFKIGLDGSINVNDSFLIQTNIYKHFPKAIEKQFKNRIDSLKTILKDSIYKIKNALISKYGLDDSNFEILKNGELPYGVRFDIQKEKYGFDIRNIKFLLSGGIDFSEASVDISKLRSIITNQLNPDILSLTKLDLKLGKNVCSLHGELHFKENVFLGMEGTIPINISLLDKDFRFDLSNLISLPKALLEFIFYNKETLELTYDDLSLIFIKSESHAEKDLLRLHCKARICNSPGIDVPVEIRIPTDLAQKNKFGLEVLVDSKSFQLKNFIPKELILFENKEGLNIRSSFVKDKNNMPVGISIESDLTIPFLNDLKVSLPQILINRKGIRINGYDKIAFTIPVNTPIPPFLWLSKGYAEMNKDFIKIGGIMTLSPGQTMEDVILMDGSFTYYGKKLESLDEMKLFRMVSLGKSETIIDLDKKTLTKKIDIGGPFKNFLHFQGNGTIDAEKKIMDCKGTLKVFQMEVTKPEVNFDLNTQTLSGSTKINLIGQTFNGNFNSGPLFREPAFSGTADFSLLGVKLTNIQLNIKENWTDLSFSVFNIRTGVTLPSPQQLSKSQIEKLIKELITPDLDIEEAVKQILNGNFKVNPLSNFGSGKGGGKSKGGGGKGGGNSNKGVSGMSKGNFRDSKRPLIDTKKTNTEIPGVPNPGPVPDPNNIGTINGKYKSDFKLKHKNGFYSIFEHDIEVVKIPNEIAILIITSSLLDPNKVKIIDINGSTVYLITNSNEVVSFNSEKSFLKSKDQTSTLLFSNSEKILENELLKSNLKSLLNDRLNENDSSPFGIYNNSIVYYKHPIDNKFIYYAEGAKQIIENDAGIDHSILLKTLIK